ncbi:hypothetical protein ACI2I2_15730 [Scandinavium sp. NPDC088450]|uniref:hypothetical protein n=1 Tax=Scandinavium sp. NPDC088450 TaxID=3364514 RepID=UPI00384B18A4
MLKIISLFFLIMIQLFLSVAHAAKMEAVSEVQLHKLPMQRFMIHVKKPANYSLDVLVKRKYPYGKELNAEDKPLQRSELKGLRDFIRELSGVIVVYDFRTDKKVLEYNLPFTVDNPGCFSSGQFYSGVNEDVWDGMRLKGGKLESIGYYMVYAELYSKGSDYDEFVLAFTADRGFK